LLTAPVAPGASPFLDPGREAGFGALFLFERAVGLIPRVSGPAGNLAIAAPIAQAPPRSHRSHGPLARIAQLPKSIGHAAVAPLRRIAHAGRWPLRWIIAGAVAFLLLLVLASAAFARRARPV
jgi:hypothetical protein